MKQVSLICFSDLPSMLETSIDPNFHVSQWNSFQREAEALWKDRQSGLCGRRVFHSRNEASLSHFTADAPTSHRATASGTHWNLHCHIQPKKITFWEWSVVWRWFHNIVRFRSRFLREQISSVKILNLRIAQLFPVQLLPQSQHLCQHHLQLNRPSSALQCPTTFLLQLHPPHRSSVHGMKQYSQRRFSSFNEDCSGPILWKAKFLKMNMNMSPKPPFLLWRRNEKSLLKLVVIWLMESLNNMWTLKDLYQPQISTPILSSRFVVLAFASSYQDDRIVVAIINETQWFRLIHLPLQKEILFCQFG